MKAATCRLSISDYADTISIHAAREGGDYAENQGRLDSYISIHAAREGGDCLLFQLVAAKAEFQSTPPVKAATCQSMPSILRYKISIHAAREGGDPRKRPKNNDLYISIHAAREGGDVCRARSLFLQCYFNPRRP